MCVTNGLPVGMYSAHSFRVGGATALHCNGVPFEAIRRFGRWLSDCFKIYLRNDEIALRYLGGELGSNHGLLAQHRAVAKNQQLVQFEEKSHHIDPTPEHRWGVGGYDRHYSTP